MNTDRLTGISPIAGYEEKRQERKDFHTKLSNPQTKKNQEVYHRIIDNCGLWERDK